MANRGYDVVVDVDAEVRVLWPSRPTGKANLYHQGDLGHTDLQEDNLEFHSSSMQLSRLYLMIIFFFLYQLSAQLRLMCCSRFQ